MSERFFLCSGRQTKGSDGVNCVCPHPPQSSLLYYGQHSPTYLLTAGDIPLLFLKKRNPRNLNTWCQMIPKGLPAFGMPVLRLLEEGMWRGIAVSIVDCLAVSASVSSLTLLRIIACLTLEHM